MNLEWRIFRLKKWKAERERDDHNDDDEEICEIMKGRWTVSVCSLSFLFKN